LLAVPHDRYSATAAPVLAILATMRFTACRAGAVAKLRLGDFQEAGPQYVLRFQEKGGKSREIPVRHDLEGFILAYIQAACIAGEAKDSPLFRASNGRSRKLAAKPLGTGRICELVKRRLKDAGLPLRLSPHSFRVTAITDLLIEPRWGRRGHGSRLLAATVDRTERRPTWSVRARRLLTRRRSHVRTSRPRFTTSGSR